MAIEITQKLEQSGSSAHSSIEITEAVEGRLLVAFIGITASVAEPKIKDNVNGESGWKIHATHAVSGTNVNSLWMAYRLATGKEKKLEATGGTVQGFVVFEAAGASEEVDVIVHQDNTASAATATSPSVTTPTGNDLIVAAISGTTNSSGLIVEQWTGGPPELKTATPSTGSRVFGGAAVASGEVKEKTFTLSWTTGKTFGMIVAGFKEVKASGHMLAMII